jgi:hypothetical protein
VGDVGDVGDGTLVIHDSTFDTNTAEYVSDRESGGLLNFPELSSMSRAEQFVRMM